MTMMKTKRRLFSACGKEGLLRAWWSSSPLLLPTWLLGSSASEVSSKGRPARAPAANHRVRGSGEAKEEADTSVDDDDEGRKASRDHHEGPSLNTDSSRGGVGILARYCAPLPLCSPGASPPPPLARAKVGNVAGGGGGGGRGEQSGRGGGDGGAESDIACFVGRGRGGGREWRTTAGSRAG